MSQEMYTQQKSVKELTDDEVIEKLCKLDPIIYHGLLERIKENRLWDAGQYFRAATGLDLKAAVFFIGLIRRFENI